MSTVQQIVVSIDIAAAIIGVIGTILYFCADYEDRKKEKEWKRKNGLK